MRSSTSLFRPPAQGEFLLAEHLDSSGHHRLPADFGQLADVEHQGFEIPRGSQPHFLRAGFGVGGDGDLDHDHVGDRPPFWPLHVIGDPRLDPGDELLDRRTLPLRAAARGGLAGGHHRVAGGHHGGPRQAT